MARGGAPVLGVVVRRVSSAYVYDPQQRRRLSSFEELIAAATVLRRNLQ